MNTRHDDTAATWRDIAAELNDEQRAELGYWERHPELPPKTDGSTPSPEQHRETLLRIARGYATRNLAAIRYADVPEPQDADSDKVTAWVEWDDDTFVRFFRGTRRQVRHMSVIIDGVQHADGTVERTVRVFPGEHDDGEMDVQQAHLVAVALVEAAAEMDRLADQ